MTQVDVSVIIPTFHRETVLLEAIGSALTQTGVTLQIIVIDDSAEGTARHAVSSLGDARVEYISRAEPSGGRPALVRNEGAKAAVGRYLYFLDDDDVLQAGTLATMTRALDAVPTAGMAFGVVEPFGSDPQILRNEKQYFVKAAGIARGVRGRRELSARLVFLPAILVNSACMARRTAFVAAGGYDSEIPVCEDAEMWGRIARASGYVFVDKPVVRYRTGAPSLMRSLVENDEKLLVSYRRIHEKYRQLHGSWDYWVTKLWARTLLARAHSGEATLAPAEV